MSDPSVEDVERFNTEQLINFLRTKNLNLNITDYKKIRDERVAGSDFLQLTREILRAEPYKFPDGPARRVATFVNNLNSQSKFYHKIVYLYASRVIQQTSFKAVIFVIFT